jgi:membrane protein
MQIPSWLKSVWNFIETLIDRIVDDRVPRMAAAMSYYTIFAMAPILIIVIWILGLVFGAEVARGEIIGTIQDLIGPKGAAAVQSVVENAYRDRDSTLATIISFATLLIASTGVFVEMQDSLNNIWGVQPRPGRPITNTLRTRLYSFAMVLSMGFVLVLSLIVSAIISAIGAYFVEKLPEFSDVSFFMLRVADFLIPLLVIMLMLAVIYRVLPDVEIAWKDVWIGAAITAVLFTIGKYLIGLYIANSSFTSSYGAAGSLVIVLVWVFFTTMIFLIGAEITEMTANRLGRRLRPSSYAMYMPRRWEILQEQYEKYKAEKAEAENDRLEASRRLRGRKRNVRKVKRRPGRRGED